MWLIDKLKKILPKRREPRLVNNVPNERENIRKTFGKFCNAKHGTKNGKICSKCTAVLSTVLIKISRCPYGIAKPICDKCETPCFGEECTNNFRDIMKSGSKKMFLSHPIMTIKHKAAGLSVEYAKMQRDKKFTDKQKEQEKKLKTKLANITRSPKTKSQKTKKR